LVLISKAIEKLNIGKMILLPFIVVLMATSILIASYIFDKTKKISDKDLWKIIKVSATILAITAAFSFIVDKVIKKVSFVDIIKGALITLVVAGTIMLTSWILNQGTYEKYPGLLWAAGVGASLVVFGVAAVALGAVALTGIGLAAFAVGLPMILTLAGTIVATSHILAKGDYNVPGLLPWAVATALLYSTFTPIILVLAAVGAASKIVEFFGGENPFVAANGMILTIAQTIVDVSHKLKEGDYTGGPTLEWAGGIAVALGAFAPIYAMMMANKIFEIFGGGGVGPDDFVKAIHVIVDGIVSAAQKFKGAQVAFEGGPKKEWAEGVGGAIGAFSPVYAVLAKSKDTWYSKGGPTVDEMAKAIETIADGIVVAAGKFADNKAVFDLANVPKKEWGENVGAALTAFIPALEFISKNKNWFAKVDTSIINTAISATADGIVTAANKLGGGNYEKMVPEKWSIGLKNTIKSYLGVLFNHVYPNRKFLPTAMKPMKAVLDGIVFASERFKEVNKNLSDFQTKWMTSIGKVVRTYVGLAEMAYVKKWLFDSFTQQGAITKLGWLTWSIKKTAERFAYISEITSNISPEWMANVDQNVRMYVDLADYLSSTDTDYSKVSTAVSNLEKISKGYSELAKGVGKLSSELEKIDMEKLTALRSLTGSIILMSLMDSDQFKEMMDALEDKAKIFVDTINQLESATKEEPKKAGGQPLTKVKSGEKKPAERSITDLFTVMESIDNKMSELVSSNDNLSKYVNEIRDEDSKIKKRN
jgi:hypothetical protein